MNWIEIEGIPDISVESIVLLLDARTDNYYVGKYLGAEYFRIKPVIIDVSIKNFTHYCLVTPPTEGEERNNG